MHSVCQLATLLRGVRSEHEAVGRNPECRAHLGSIRLQFMVERSAAILGSIAKLTALELGAFVDVISAWFEGAHAVVAAVSFVRTVHWAALGR
jgi:hypothetical protein